MKYLPFLGNFLPQHSSVVSCNCLMEYSWSTHGLLTVYSRSTSALLINYSWSALGLLQVCLKKTLDVKTLCINVPTIPQQLLTIAQHNSFLQLPHGLLLVYSRSTPGLLLLYSQSTHDLLLDSRTLCINVSTYLPFLSNFLPQHSTVVSCNCLILRKLLDIGSCLLTLYQSF